MEHEVRAVRAAMAERDRLYAEVERGIRALVASGLTQVRIAAETGISQPMISRMLRR